MVKIQISITLLTSLLEFVKIIKYFSRLASLEEELNEALKLEKLGILDLGFINDVVIELIRNIKKECFTTSSKYPNEKQLSFASLMAFLGRFENVKKLSVVDMDLNVITTEHLGALMPCIEQCVSIVNAQSVSVILKNIKCAVLEIRKTPLQFEEKRDLEEAMANGSLKWIKIDPFSLKYTVPMNKFDYKSLTTWASSLNWDVTRIRKNNNIYELMRRS